MSFYLLDTNVISMLAPSRTGAPTAFVEWLEHMDARGLVFLSVVTIHEIEKGITLLEHRRAIAKAAKLKAWLGGLVSIYQDKIIAFDAPIAALAGQLEARAVSAGHDPGMADSMIAGTAKAHNSTIVTRNTRHFQAFGVRVMSPDEALQT